MASGLMSSLRAVLCFLVDPGVRRAALAGSGSRESEAGSARWVTVGLHAVEAQGQAVALLLARLYVAQVFWLSGLSKLRDWSSTLALFEDEYRVPLLPPEVAAYLGTAGELALPVLLVLGLGGRFAALGLNVVNVMAVLSLSDIAPAALAGHQLWGALLLAVALWGAGSYSVDAAWARWRQQSALGGGRGGLTRAAGN